MFSVTMRLLALVLPNLLSEDLARSIYPPAYIYTGIVYTLTRSNKTTYQKYV